MNRFAARFNLAVSAFGGGSATTAPPSAPTGLTLTIITAAVRLDWNPVSGATSYNIYRSLSGGGGTLYQSGVTDNTFDDSSVLSGQSYFYEVTAVNGVGESARSTEEEVIPQEPATVTGLAATTLGITTIDLDWDNSAGVSWRVEWQLAGGDWSSLVGFESPVSTNGYQIQDLTATTAYDVRVRSSNSFGVSLWEELDNVSTIGAAEETEVSCNADVAGNLHGKYFLNSDAIGLVSLQLNCGARKQKLELDFAGVNGGMYAVSGDGLHLFIDNGTGPSCYWFDTGTENVPSVSASFFVPVVIDVLDSGNQIASTFLATAIANGFNDAGSAGGGVKLENTTAQFVTAPDVGNAGVGISVVVSGRDAAVDPGTATRNLLVNITDDDSAETIASALVDAIIADGIWSAAATLNIVRITELTTGPRVDAADVDTGFGISTITQGA